MPHRLRADTEPQSRRREPLLRQAQGNLVDKEALRTWKPGIDYIEYRGDTPLLHGFGTIAVDKRRIIIMLIVEMMSLLTSAGGNSTRPSGLSRSSRRGIMVCLSRRCKQGPCYFCGSKDHGQAGCTLADKPNQPPCAICVAEKRPGTSHLTSGHRGNASKNNTSVSSYSHEQTQPLPLQHAQVPTQPADDQQPLTPVPLHTEPSSAPEARIEAPLQSESSVGLDKRIDALLDSTSRADDLVTDAVVRKLVISVSISFP